MDLKLKKMRKALVYFHLKVAGTLIEEEKNRNYLFVYDTAYSGEPVSLTMPVEEGEFRYNRFPPFFDGLLPEGVQLEGLLSHRKIDRYDFFEQLLATGSDLVGAVTVEALDE